jgi:hypothetical protein
LNLAHQELAGVGDAALGEWEERGDVAVHLRRRLTADEAANIGPVIDVRGTWEGQKRLTRMRRFLPPQIAQLPDEALP